MEGLAPLVKTTSEAIEKKANLILQADDITFPQVRVLFVLHRFSPSFLSLKELERTLNASQQTTAGIVSRLELKGYVKGCHDNQDRRVKRICLTESGAQIALASRKKLEEIEAELTSALTSVEKDTLIELLTRVYHNIK